MFIDHRHHLAGFGKEKSRGSRRIIVRPKKQSDEVDKMKDLDPNLVCLECESEVTLAGFCDRCGTLNVAKRVIPTESVLPQFVHFTDLSPEDRRFCFSR